MLSITLFLFYIYVGLHSFGEVFTEEYLSITYDISMMTVAMAIGLYFMRAESASVDGIFTLAGNINSASPEQIQEFSQMFRSARESIYTAGIFFWLLMVFLAASGGTTRIDVIPRHFNATFLMIIPVIVTMLLETLLRASLKIRARFSARMKFDKDWWLSWLGLVVLGCIQALSEVSDSRDGSCFIIVISPFVAALLIAVARLVFKTRNVSAKERAS